MSDVEYLDLDDLVRLARVLKVGPIRDLGLLDSAVARARSALFGAEAYPTLQGKAAALLHSLARNDALIDGNRRLGWLATVVLLRLNGRTAALDDEGAFQLVMDVSEGLTDVDEIAYRLQVP